VGLIHDAVRSKAYAALIGRMNEFENKRHFPGLKKTKKYLSQDS
jgi:hypothetical protein